MSDLSDTNKRARPILFNPDAAWVPLGKVVAAVVIVAGAAVWADRMQRTLDAALLRLDSMDRKLARLPDSAYYRSWTKLLRSSNPTMVVPDFDPPEGG